MTWSKKLGLALLSLLAIILAYQLGKQIGAWIIQSGTIIS